MARVVLAAVLIGLALAAAALINRRRVAAAPTQPTWSVPAQLDRHDFARAAAPWLVVVFSSTTCDSCATVSGLALRLEAGDVAVDVVPVQERRELHARYHVEAVPMVVFADAEGVVRASFVGPPPDDVSLADVLAGVRSNPL
ncbi:MAG: hypothetical protein AB7L13_18150 [Acidimicrobiia bacterium]